MTSQRVQRVIRSRVDRKLPMVNMNGIWITRGHPMYVYNERLSSSASSQWCEENKKMVYDWWRPDEVVQPRYHQIDFVYNLVLDDGHTVICSPPQNHDDDDARQSIICCTLGRDCGARLRKARPDQVSCQSGTWHHIVTLLHLCRALPIK
jgi:hypothetical protein